MVFEGSEKKIEILFDSNITPLRDKPKSYWESLVALTGAQILSEISNETMTAYLLSESSLFIYDNAITMITCGQTELIKVVEPLVKEFSLDSIQAFFYERKNEIFARYQKSHFFDDLKELEKHIPGKAMRFGKEDEHHLYLYCTDTAYLPEDSDHTLEVLMHGVSSECTSDFQLSNNKHKKLPQPLEGLVPGKMDSYFFEPCGFSLNAIDGPYYTTLHMTPEAIGNYTSLETDAIKPEEQASYAQKVIQNFRPASFDIITFSKTQAMEFNFPGWMVRNHYKIALNNGYIVEYRSFSQPQTEVLKPFMIDKENFS